MPNTELEYYKRWIVLCSALFAFVLGQAQVIPAADENIAYLSTFGSDADPEWGDDDHVNIVFFLVPEEYKRPFYIRIFDPDCGGKHDLKTQEPWDTKTRFSVIGGQGAHSNPDARGHILGQNYKSGTVLNTVEFGLYTKEDDWYNMGPFNPAEGEYSEVLKGNIFKVVVEGIEGNDGNGYQLALSTQNARNIPIPGGNAFIYNYTFRLKYNAQEVAHIYPYIDNNVVSIKQHNFDFDDEGVLKVYSVSKNGHVLAASGENEWVFSEHPISEKEKGKSLDIQIVKSQNRHNDLTFYLLNQYNEAIPFFAIPIGGIPKYNFNISLKYDYVNKSRSY